MAKKTTLADLDSMRDAVKEFKKRKLDHAELFEVLMNKQLAPFNQNVDKIKDKDFLQFLRMLS